MKFKYKSQTKIGNHSEGIIDAPDRIKAAKIIRDKGEIPISVSEFSEKKWWDISFDFLSSINLQEKIIFTRNLSGMITAGLSMPRALDVLRKQSTNVKFKQVMEGLLADIDKGGTLSSGMQKYPKVFSSLFISMVRAGEESGSLPQSLKEVGNNLEKIYNLNKKIKGALMYPAIILSVVGVVGILMFIYVVPTITNIFKDLNIELPASTQFIIWLSDFMSNNPILIFAIVIGTVAGLIYLSKIPIISRYIDLIILKLPVIGTIAQQVNTARTMRTLTSLLSSGVEVTKAFSITKDVLQNVHYKELIDLTITRVQKGAPISQTFKERPDLYPVMVSEMIEVGEETGRLTDMLLDIAVFYEAEVDGKTKDLSTIIEPVLMVFIGVAVGFFAVSMITPMYSIMDTVQ
jgi:type IV pilus assembly protein PilC